MEEESREAVGWLRQLLEHRTILDVSDPARVERQSLEGLWIVLARTTSGIGGGRPATAVVAGPDRPAGKVPAAAAQRWGEGASWRLRRHLLTVRLTAPLPSRLFAMAYETLLSVSLPQLHTAALAATAGPGAALRAGPPGIGSGGERGYGGHVRVALAVAMADWRLPFTSGRHAELRWAAVLALLTTASGRVSREAQRALPLLW